MKSQFIYYIYSYRPRPFHFSGPIILVFIGYAILRAENYSVAGWYLAGGLALITVIMLVWMATIGIIQSLADLEYDMTSDQERAEIIKEKYYPNTHITKKDERWQDWAVHVLGGMPLSERRWTGSRKPFSQGEYSEKMRELIDKNVLRYANGKNQDNGYQVSGAGGWDYIRAMSEGRANLPLPSPAEKSA